jgi:multicomponent Na+:H+ antiporter subunit A
LSEAFKTTLLNFLLLFPFVAAAVIAAFPRIVRLLPAQERESALAAPPATAITTVGLSLAVGAAMAGLIAHGDAVADYLWTPDFFQFRLRLDALGLYALLAVLAGLMITALWAAGEGLRDHVRWAAFVAAAGAFTGVIVAADLVLLYAFWELSALAVWAALGLTPGPGRRYLTWSHAGGLCILVAMLWVAILARDTHIYTAGSGLLVHLLSSVKWTGWLLALGLGARLALAPFHFWLLDLCRGAGGKWNLALLGMGMVVAGYGAVRLIFYILPGYGAAAVAWLPMTMGLITAAYAGARALLSDDVCGAASHVAAAAAGQIAFGIGLGMQGRAYGLGGALALLVPLALAAPLLAAGAGHGPGGLTWSDRRGDHRVPLPCDAAMIAAALTLSGLPPLAGFWGQRAIATASWQAGGVAVVVAALIAPALILAYGVKVAIARFGRPRTANRQSQPGRWGLVGAVVLASLVFGVTQSLWWPHLFKIARALSGG